MSALILHEDPASGNCYKIRLTAAHLGLPLETRAYAACFYLADGSDLIPDDRFDRADMLHWMFWEQYNHEPNIATLRFWLRHVGLEALTAAQRMQIIGKRESGIAALALMDDRLEDHPFLAADRFTVADICLFAYTHVADEADFDLEAYPAVVAWMERIMTMPGYISMDESAMADAS